MECQACGYEDAGMLWMDIGDHQYQVCFDCSRTSEDEIVAAVEKRGSQPEQSASAKARDQYYRDRETVSKHRRSGNPPYLGSYEYFNAKRRLEERDD